MRGVINTRNVTRVFFDGHGTGEKGRGPCYVLIYDFYLSFRGNQKRSASWGHRDGLAVILVVGRSWALVPRILKPSAILVQVTVHSIRSNAEYEMKSFRIF